MTTTIQEQEQQLEAAYDAAWRAEQADDRIAIINQIYGSATATFPRKVLKEDPIPAVRAAAVRKIYDPELLLSLMSSEHQEIAAAASATWCAIMSE